MSGQPKSGGPPGQGPGGTAPAASGSKPVPQGDVADRAKGIYRRYLAEKGKFDAEAEKIGDLIFDDPQIRKDLQDEYDSGGKTK